MIKLLGNIPRGEFGLACSGGVDSMAVLDFLVKGKHNPHVIYFNHNTDHGDEAEVFIRDYCSLNGLKLSIGRTELKPISNKEKVWSDLRYDFFSKFDFPIMTCHHLDDCVETYIFSCLRGFQSVIPYSKGNVIRPFLLNEKSVFEDWCLSKDVPFIQDDSNFCVEHTRNRIRKNIVPEALLVNPGLKSIVKKQIKENGNSPMSAKEIWNYILKNKIANSGGKTPWITLNTVMSRFSKNTKLDLSLQNRNPEKIEIFEIVSRSPLKFILLNKDYHVKEESPKIEKIELYDPIENPFKQSICILGDPESGKSFTIRDILRKEKHNFIIVEPTATTTNLLSQFSSRESDYIPSRIGKLLIQASENPDKLYTAVVDKFHKSNVIEMVNDELKHAISLRRYGGDRFILSDDATEYLSEYLVEDDGGNFEVPDNFGFIFISSKPRIITNNKDIFDRLDIVLLKDHKVEKIETLEQLLGKVLSKEDKSKLASVRNDG